ncbi:MAG: A/G-specific adenine glycosylase [Planctomycetia bacterium]|nr:A/G-specific adenine glycosylase [Planctomycetia bacterium]
MPHKKLLTWFSHSARKLPWRETTDPYAIWVSEIMLQQTQVTTVINYFPRFMEAFPTISALASAPEDAVLRLWEGLGYYRRARQLHAAAKMIQQEYAGEFPTDYTSVIKLPGIGRYTAGAILSISQNQHVPILEANTARLFARLNALELPTDSAAAQKILWQYAQKLVSTTKYPPGQINQALMEVGSLICTPQKPACTKCPLQKFCAAYDHHCVEKIPVTSRKLQYENRHEAAVIIRRPTPKKKSKKNVFEYCLLHYAPQKRWGGLWDFPRTEIPPHATPDTFLPDFIHTTTGLKIHLGHMLHTFRHSVTKYRITLHCYEGILHSKYTTLHKKTPDGEEIRWVAFSDLSDYPLNVTGRKITKFLSKYQELLVFPDN